MSSKEVDAEPRAQPSFGPPRRATTLPVRFEELSVPTPQRDFRHREKLVKYSKAPVREPESERSRRPKTHRHGAGSISRGPRQYDADDDEPRIVGIIPQRHMRRREHPTRQRRVSPLPSHSELDSSSDSITSKPSLEEKIIIREKYQDELDSISEESSFEAYSFTLPRLQLDAISVDVKPDQSTPAQHMGSRIAPSGLPRSINVVQHSEYTGEGFVGGLHATKLTVNTVPEKSSVPFFRWM